MRFCFSAIFLIVACCLPINSAQAEAAWAKDGPAIFERETRSPDGGAYDGVGHGYEMGDNVTCILTHGDLKVHAEATIPIFEGNPVGGNGHGSISATWKQNFKCTATKVPNFTVTITSSISGSAKAHPYPEQGNSTASANASTSYVGSVPCSVPDTDAMGNTVYQKSLTKWTDPPTPDSTDVTTGNAPERTYTMFFSLTAGVSVYGDQTGRGDRTVEDKAVADAVLTVGDPVNGPYPEPPPI